jgi:uncharacterized protein DUF5947
MSEELARKAATRRQADLVASLRRLSKAPAVARPSSGAPRADAERCDLCGNPIGADHRHLLQIEERYILCVCESCLALRGGDRQFRPTGTRVVWLDGLELPDELWASFSIPIGLAFFLHSSATGGIVSLYPSPAGATESELDPAAWRDLARANPILASLEPDAEALIVNRTSEPRQHAIAPIDECYRLVGMVKTSWEGISGGTGPERAIATFFAGLEERGTSPG